MQTAPRWSNRTAQRQAAFDSNGDGKLTATDTRWADFRVWQDKNGDGVSDVGELRTLAEAGIASFDLIPTRTNWQSGGNSVKGFASYRTTGGNTHLLAEHRRRCLSQAHAERRAGLCTGQGCGPRS